VSQPAPWPSYLFPIVFAAIWLSITTLLGFLSGWFRLMAIYPDRPEAPIRVFGFQSGWMGSLKVSYSSILTLSACPSGLRVAVWPLLGPFCRKLFIPWGEISVERGSFLWMPSATLRFGAPANGELGLRADVADRIAAASGVHWPETVLVKRETRSQAAISVLKEWRLSTALASLFFIVAPRLVAPSGAAPPIALAIAFPAVVFGVYAVFRYFARIRT
jgi:hypothetical protein